MTAVQQFCVDKRLCTAFSFLTIGFPFSCFFFFTTIGALFSGFFSSSSGQSSRAVLCRGFNRAGDFGFSCGDGRGSVRFSAPERRRKWEGFSWGSSTLLEEVDWEVRHGMRCQGIEKYGSKPGRCIMWNGTGYCGQVWNTQYDTECIPYAVGYVGVACDPMCSHGIYYIGWWYVLRTYCHDLGW